MSDYGWSTDFDADPLATSYDDPTQDTASDLDAEPIVYADPSAGYGDCCSEPTASDETLGGEDSNGDLESTDISVKDSTVQAELDQLQVEVDALGSEAATDGSDETGSWVTPANDTGAPAVGGPYEADNAGSWFPADSGAPAVGGTYDPGNETLTIGGGHIDPALAGLLTPGIETVTVGGGHIDPALGGLLTPVAPQTVNIPDGSSGEFGMLLQAHEPYGGIGDIAGGGASSFSDANSRMDATNLEMSQPPGVDIDSVHGVYEWTDQAGNSTRDSANIHRDSEGNGSVLN
ncbi:MAG: hypothetical protein M3Z46_10295 [Actinomycetota bacterium]|nr:hypothetical protein [Actinomycetota bacterium]